VKIKKYCQRVNDPCTAKLLQNVKPWVKDISRVLHSMDIVWLSGDIERFLGQTGQVYLRVVLERANVFQKNGIDPSKYTITLVHGLSLDVDDLVDVSLAYREKMFSQKPPFSCIDNSKRSDDSIEKYSLFEVNYNGMFHELPLRNSLEIGLTIVEGDPDIKKMYDMAELCGLINLYIGHVPKTLAAYYFKNLSFDDYHGEIQSKLKSHEKLKMDADSMKCDELVSWEKDVYGGGCFDVGGSFKGFDYIDEHVGYDDCSLPGKSKDEFSNEVILDDGVSSPATTLSLSNYGNLVNVIGLNEDVGDDDLKDTGCSCNNDLKDLD
ncbi:hypothetical protein Tco_0581763, partial [Tanacetum coccineum]